MKYRILIFERTKSYEKAVRIICFSILIVLFSISVSLANDKYDVKFSTLDKILVNKNVINENYPQDTKSIEVFNADLIDTDPQEIAKNIEDISKKYNIDINNISEDISERNNEVFNEDIIVQSPDEEKILLIRLSGKITIKDIIDFYKSGINLYHPVSKNTLIVGIEARNITKLKSYPFINGIREYKLNDKINPDDKIRIDRIIQSNKNASHQSDSQLKVYIWPLGKGNDSRIQDIQQLGVEKISYDNTPKVYYAEVLPSKINSILNLKWVKKNRFSKRSSGAQFAS